MDTNTNDDRLDLTAWQRYELYRLACREQGIEYLDYQEWLDS